jgi:hypothetical protein
MGTHPALLFQDFLYVDLRHFWEGKGYLRFPKRHTVNNVALVDLVEQIWGQIN